MNLRFLIPLLFVLPLHAATYTAASPSYADVNDCINHSGANTCSPGGSHTAIAGDTIVIPAGSATWTSTMTITVPITLKGTGTPNTTPSQFGAGTLSTIIIDNAGSSASLITFAGSAITYGTTTHISTLDIEPESNSTALFSPVSLNGNCTASGCALLRMDNIGFGLTTGWTESGNGAPAASMVRMDDYFGVYDHNTVNASVFANYSLSSYLGVGSNGDNSWAQPDTFGTESAIYYENNIFNTLFDVTDIEFFPTGFSGNYIGGGRQVGRFNHINSVSGTVVAFGGHGLDTLSRGQGMRQTEVYGNTNSCTGAATTYCGSCATSFRSGGTGIIFGNTCTGTTGNVFQQIADFSIYRNVYATASGWGSCDGTSPYDTNDGVTYYDTSTAGSTGTASNNVGPGNLTMTFSPSPGWTTNQWAPAGSPYSLYDVTGTSGGAAWGSEIVSNTANSLTIENPISESTWYGGGLVTGDRIQILRATVCADQGGRGQGQYVSGSTPSPSSAMNQALDPVYEFADTVSTVTNYYWLVLNSNNRLLANRDYYTDLGAAAQSSSTSPFNGTGGVGHGTLAYRPTTCTTGVAYWATDQGSWNTSGNGFGNGVLYKCTATNTWSTYYTPYTYPHPLVSGGPVNPPPPTISVILLN